MKREKEFVKNGAILSIATVVSKMVSFITLPVVTGCLTKIEYGTYDLITVLVSLVLPIATLEIQAAAFRYLVNVRGNEIEQKRIITNIMFFTVVVCSITLILLFVILCFGQMSLTIRLLVVSYFFVDIILVTERQVARGLAMNSSYSISVAINSIMEMLLMVVLLLVFHCGLTGALIAITASQLLSLVYLTRKCRLSHYIDFNLLSKSQTKTMLNYAWPLIPNSLSSWLMRVSDRFVILWFIGVEANAVYAVANKLPNIFNLIQGSFSMAWQENASLSVNDKDTEMYYSKMFDSIFNVLVGIMAILIAFTPITFRLLIQGEYNDAYNHILILYLAAMFSMLSSYMGGIYIAHEKSKAIGITTILSFMVDFLIIICAIRYIGIYAASIATLVSYICLAVYRMVDVQRFQKIKFNVAKIILLILVLAVMIMVCSMREMPYDIVNMIFSLCFAFLLNKKIVLKATTMAKKKILK